MEGKTVMETKQTRSVAVRPDYGVFICGLIGDNVQKGQRPRRRNAEQGILGQIKVGLEVSQNNLSLMGKGKRKPLERIMLSKALGKIILAMINR